MGIEIPICQNIKDKYTYSKNYTYNKHFFVSIVILSSLIMYAKLGSFPGWRPVLLG